MTFFKVVLTSAVLAFTTLPVLADMVVVNRRSVLQSDDLELNVYRNDGCPISVEFLQNNSVSYFFQCEGDWDWDAVQKLSRYYRDKVNMEKEIDYFDVISQFPSQCEKKDYTPGKRC